VAGAGYTTGGVISAIIKVGLIFGSISVVREAVVFREYRVDSGVSRSIWKMGVNYR
jgi:hypothetical protein